MCGNYSREETIQGRKLYEEIRYTKLILHNRCHANMYALFELSKIIGCKKKLDDSVAGGSQQKPDVRDLKH